MFVIGEQQQSGSETLQVQVQRGVRVKTIDAESEGVTAVVGQDLAAAVCRCGEEEENIKCREVRGVRNS